MSASESNARAKMTNGANHANNLAYLEKKKIEEMNNKLKLEDRVKSAIFTRNNNSNLNKLNESNGNNDQPVQKRQENESRVANFVRGFRRENSDFFPLSKRHSAILGENLPQKNLSPQIYQRSSAIFQRNRNKGEPELTNFSPKRDTLTSNSSHKNNSNNATPTHQIQQNSSPSQKQIQNQNQNQQRQSTPLPKNLDFLRIRREKTESVIFVSRKSATGQQLFAPQSQVKITKK